jgi:hypothetical protein
MYVLEGIYKKAEFAASQCSHVFPPLQLTISHGKGEGKNLNSFTAARQQLGNLIRMFGK